MHVLAHLLLTCTVFFFYGLQRWRLFALKHLIQDKTEKHKKCVMMVMKEGRVLWMQN